MSKIKILHVVNIPFVIPYFLGDQINYFANHDFEVFICSSFDHRINDLQKKFTFRYLNIDIGRNINIFKDILNTISLAIFCKRNNIDIVVGHTPKAAFIAMLSSKIIGIKKRYYFQHGLLFEGSRCFKKYLLFLLEKISITLSSQTICVSPSVYNKNISLKLCNEKKIKLISNGSCNGVDFKNKFNKSLMNLFKRDELLNKFKFDNSDFIVGFVGRLSNEKGIDQLLLAFKFFLNNYPNIKLLLIGPLDSRDGLKKDSIDLLSELPNVICVGEVYNTECYYDIMSVFILPSKREGFPTVVLEASSMNLPVITTRNTGCVDSILENTTGIFCEIDSSSIANSIIFYYNNKNIVFKHGNNGRSHIVNNFDQINIWDQLLTIYCNE